MLGEGTDPARDEADALLLDRLRQERERRERLDREQRGNLWNG
jgi:hypothetical protein